MSGERGGGWKAGFERIFSKRLLRNSSPVVTTAGAKYSGFGIWTEGGVAAHEEGLTGVVTEDWLERSKE